MHFSLRLLTFITITSLLFSCTQSSKRTTALAAQEQAFDSIMTQVIALHDDVMPKMSEVNHLIKTLDAKIDTTAQGTSYANAQKDLKNAHDGMMNWMTEFSEAFPHSDAPETNLDSLQHKMERLKVEVPKVQKVKEDITSSIANAKQLLSTAVKDSVQ